MRHFLFLILCMVLTSLVWGADQSTSTLITDQAAQMSPTDLAGTSPYTMKHFIPNLESNFVHVFSKSNYASLLFTAIGGGIATTADDEVHDYFKERNPGQAPETVLGVIGKPYVLAPTIGSLLIMGQHSSNAKFHDFTYALAQAYTLNYAIVTSIKYGVGRERPDHSNTQSFPSGHAADGFMIAAVIHNYYGPKASVFGYTFATLLATSRLKIDKHWFSDVVTGAALGYVVGSSVCNHMTFTHNHLQMTMMPLVEPKEHRLGLNIYATF